LIAGDNATITTPSVYVKSAALAYRLYVKVNNFHLDKLKGFTIRVFTNSSNNSSFIKIFEGSNINIAEVPSNKVKSYVRAEIVASDGKIIDNIEIYVRYKENENVASLIPVEQHAGTFISKIYDLGSNSTYIWDSIDAEIKAGSENAAKISVRAAREDNKSFVFSSWYPYTNVADDDYKTRFKDYRLFQYKIELNNGETEIKLNSINLKAV
jgi:hypothetical protein